MVVPGQHVIGRSSFYWCASGVNPTQNHPAFSANSSTKTINVTTTKLVSISSDLCLSHSLRHLCPWGKQARLKGNLGETSQELFLWRLVGGGQQGSRLDKTVLKSSWRDWASYFSFLNGGNTHPPPTTQKREKACWARSLTDWKRWRVLLQKDRLVTELSCVTPKAVYHLSLIRQNTQISW